MIRLFLCCMAIFTSAAFADRKASEIMDVVTQNNGVLRGIYNQHLTTAPGDYGKVKVKLTISKEGLVVRSEIIESDEFQDSTFPTKILHAITRYKFLEIDSGNTTVTIPFTFTEDFSLFRNDGRTTSPALKKELYEKQNQMILFLKKNADQPSLQEKATIRRDAGGKWFVQGSKNTRLIVHLLEDLNLKNTDPYVPYIFNIELKPNDE